MKVYSQIQLMRMQPCVSFEPIIFIVCENEYNEYIIKHMHIDMKLVELAM